MRKEKHMQAARRQFDQILQMLGGTKIPMSLLRLVEAGNGFKKPIYGGGFMNGPELIPVLIAWKAAGLDDTKCVTKYKEYLDYKEKPKDEKATIPKSVTKVVRKKEVAASHG